jgi:hypothetical protein
LLRDKFGGCPVYWPFGVRHGGDVSLVCCCRTEREKARPDSAVWLMRVARGSGPSGRTVRV